jgi:hypothetical protein
MSTALRIVGGYHLALGVFMFVAPGAFYDLVGGFPPENHHYIRDVATFYAAIGVVAWMAATRPAWRVPVLLLILVEYAIHVVNHLIDVGNATSTGVGVFDVVSLAAVTAAIGWLLARAHAEERA